MRSIWNRRCETNILKGSIEYTTSLLQEILDGTTTGERKGNMSYVTMLQFTVEMLPTLRLLDRIFQYHHYQSRPVTGALQARYRRVTGALARDKSFKWGKFHQDMNHHNNILTSHPFTEDQITYSSRDNFGNNTARYKISHMVV